MVPVPVRARTGIHIYKFIGCVPAWRQGTSVLETQRTTNIQQLYGFSFFLCIFFLSLYFLSFFVFSVFVFSVFAFSVFVFSVDLTDLVTDRCAVMDPTVEYTSAVDGTVRQPHRRPPVAARPPACDERKGIRKKVLGLYTAWFTGQDDATRREIAAIDKPTAKYDRFHKENAEAMGELEHGYENLRRDMGQAIGKYHAANPVRAVAAVDTAATASTGRAAPIEGDDQDMQIDNGIMPSTAVGATAEDDVSVLMCLNQMLNYYHTSGFSNSHPATRDELDKHLSALQDTVEHDGTLSRDLVAVCLLLRDRFGDENYEFYATDPAEILRADQTGGRFLLVHGCLERAKDAVARWSHYDDLEGADYDQLVTEWPEEYDDQYDEQHMHTILIPPGKRGMDKRFYCHRLEPEWGTRGVTIKHLGLRDDGQSECRGYYMKSISRVYEICVTEDVDSDDGDFDPRAHRPGQEEHIEVSHATEDHPLGNIVPGGQCTRQGTVFNRGTPDRLVYDLTDSDFSDDDASPEIISDGKQRMLSTPVQMDDVNGETAILHLGTYFTGLVARVPSNARCFQRNKFSMESLRTIASYVRLRGG
eukprot:COSAG06_NODE_7571_length_2455_cov_1.360781_2_plen_588_part_00